MSFSFSVYGAIAVCHVTSDRAEIYPCRDGNKTVVEWTDFSLG